jgi:hypothetical protein
VILLDDDTDGDCHYDCIVLVSGADREMRARARARRRVIVNAVLYAVSWRYDVERKYRATAHQ